MLERLKEGTLSRYQEVMLSLVTDDHPRAENGNVKIFDQSADFTTIIRQCARAKLLGREASRHPFEFGAREVQSMMDHFQRLGILGYSSEEIRSYIIQRLQRQNAGISEETLQGVFHESPIINDLCAFIEAFKRHGSPEQLAQQARWIQHPDGSMYKNIGSDAMRWLRKARLLGLISFEAIDRLADTKVGFIGTSVAASTAFLLATMGAENMHFVDGGIIQHSTRDRFPGALGEHHMVGRIKSEALRDQLYKKFPYGNFEAYGGYVRLDKESLESGDILLRELAEACDILVEVVDNPLMKLAIRQWLAKEYPEKPLIFMGDVGIAGSFAGVERAGIENHFNQSINNKKLEAMIARLAGAKDSTSAHDAALRAVNEMLGAHFPYDHIVQFLLNTVDSQNNQPVLPFWAQTPIAASASSIVATLLILHNIIGNGLTGKNYTIQDVPSTFVNFSPESLQAIGQMRHMLEFPC
jgi:hypothetical protein